MNAENIIRMICPGCGAAIRTRAESAMGRKGRCRGCGTLFIVDTPPRMVTPGPGLPPMTGVADPEATRLAQTSGPPEANPDATRMAAPSPEPSPAADPDATRMAESVTLSVDPDATRMSPSSEPETDPDATRMAGPTIPDPAPDAMAGDTTIPLMWQTGDRLLDTYRVEGVLGRGAFGTVYRVRHLGWHMDLAVKSPNPEALDAHGTDIFIREAETWSELGLHPHIVSCYYVRTLGGIPRVFAEYVDGGTLQERIEKDGAGDLGRKLDIAIQFAWGLAYAHARNMVHQDVKPANVMLTLDGRVKVTDFGLTRAKGGSGGGEELDIGGGRTIMVDGAGCTPAYASPEQLAGESVSRAADAWSWAVSILAMFTGGASWRVGVAAPAVLEDLLKRTGAPAAGVPEELAALLRECFALDPDKRQRDMNAVADRLIVLYREVTGQAYPLRPPRQDQARSADSLVNRALSMIDLGQRERAEDLLKEALTLQPHHPEATYNLGLIRWRAGEITDIQLVHELDDLRRSHKSSWIDEWLLSRFHLERGDILSARRVLSEVENPPAEIVQALEEMPPADDFEPEHVNTFMALGSLGYLHDGPENIDAQDRVLLANTHPVNTNVYWTNLHQDTIAESEIFPNPPLDHGSITALVRSPARHIAAVGFGSGLVWIIDLSLMQEIMSIPDLVRFDKKNTIIVNITSGCRQLIFSPDGRYLACLAPNAVMIVDLDTSRLRLFRDLCEPPLYGLLLACAPDMSTLLLVGCKTDAKSEKNVFVLLRPENDYRYLFEPESGNNGRYIGIYLSSSGDHILACKRAILETYRIVGNTIVLENVYRLPGADGTSNVKPFLSADRRFLAYNGTDGKAGSWRILDIRNGRLLCSLKHPWPVSSDSKIIDLLLLADGSINLTGLPQSQSAPFLYRKKIARPQPAPWALCRVTASEDVNAVRADYTAAMEEAKRCLNRGAFNDALQALSRVRGLDGYERDPAALRLWRVLGHRLARGAFRGAWLKRTITQDSIFAHQFCELVDGEQRLLLRHDADNRSAERIDIHTGRQEHLPWLVEKQSESGVRFDDMWGISIHPLNNKLGVYDPMSGRELVTHAMEYFRAFGGALPSTIRAYESKRLRVLISESDGTNTRLVDVLTGRELFRLHYRIGSSQMYLDPDGRSLVLCDSLLRIHSLIQENPEPETIVIPDHLEAKAILPRPQGGAVILASTKADQEPFCLLLWKPGAHLSPPTALPMRVRNFDIRYRAIAALSADGRLLAVLLPDFKILLWDMDTFSPVTELNPGFRVKKLLFAHDCSCLVVAGEGNHQGHIQIMVLDWDLRLPDFNDPRQLHMIMRAFLQRCTMTACADPSAAIPDPGPQRQGAKPQGVSCWGRAELIGFQARLALTGFGQWPLDLLERELRTLEPEARPSIFDPMMAKAEAELRSGKVYTGKRLEELDTIDVYRRLGLHGEETMLAAAIYGAGPAAVSSIVLTDRKVRYLEADAFPYSQPFLGVERLALVRTQRGLGLSVNGVGILNGIPSDMARDMMIFLRMIRIVAGYVTGRSLEIEGLR